MVMEFPDNVLTLAGHQNTGAQLKQFVQVTHALALLSCQPHCEPSPRSVPGLDSFEVFAALWGGWGQ